MSDSRRQQLDALVTIFWILAGATALIAFVALKHLYDAGVYENSQTNQNCARYLASTAAEQDATQQAAKQESATKWCDLAAQERMAESTRGMEWSGWGAFVATLVGIVLLSLTLQATRDTLKEAGKTTGAALLTVQATERATKATQDAAKAAESLGQQQARAYLQLSHLPPGLVAPWRTDRVRVGTMAIQVKNFGDTPARVTDVFFTKYIYHASKDPVTQPYYHRLPVQFKRITRALIMPGAEFIHRPRIMLFTLTEEQVNNIMRGELILWIVGFADYIDVFERRHRAGYARRFNPGVNIPAEGTEERSRTNNLPFPDAGTWNYDRERKEGEGRDWSDEGEHGSDPAS